MGSHGTSGARQARLTFVSKLGQSSITLGSESAASDSLNVLLTHGVHNNKWSSTTTVLSQGMAITSAVAKITDRFAVGGMLQAQYAGGRPAAPPAPSRQPGMGGPGEGAPAAEAAAPGFWKQLWDGAQCTVVGKALYQMSKKRTVSLTTSKDVSMINIETMRPPFTVSVRVYLRARWFARDAVAGVSWYDDGSPCDTCGCKDRLWWRLDSRRPRPCSSGRLYGWCHDWPRPGASSLAFDWATVRRARFIGGSSDLNSASSLPAAPGSPCVFLSDSFPHFLGFADASSFFPPLPILRRCPFAPFAFRRPVTSRLGPAPLAAVLAILQAFHLHFQRDCLMLSPVPRYDFPCAHTHSPINLLNSILVALLQCHLASCHFLLP